MSEITYIRVRPNYRMVIETIEKGANQVILTGLCLALYNVEVEKIKKELTESVFDEIFEIMVSQ